MRLAMLASFGIAGAILSAGGCGLDVVGGAAGADAATQVPEPASDAEVDLVDAQVEAAAGKDSAVVDSVCPPIPAKGTGGARTANVVRANDSDAGLAHVFRECPAIMLNPSTAAMINGAPKATAVVFLEWEPAALWVRFDVTDSSLAGTDDAEPYLNDSVEIYVSSDPARTSDYGTDDHHMVVDYRNVSVHRVKAGATPSPVESTATKTPAGYRVVIRIGGDLLNERLGVGKPLFVDALLSDGQNQDNYLMWSQEPHGAPAGIYPASDPRLFSPAMIVP